MIYAIARVTDDWGVLEAPGGVLIVWEEGGRLQVPAPADVTARPLKGDGWTLALEKGWNIVPGSRAGDYTLKPETQPH